MALGQGGRGVAATKTVKYEREFEYNLDRSTVVRDPLGKESDQNYVQRFVFVVHSDSNEVLNFDRSEMNL
jgi:hypothetical protein